jgi:glycosyltransferase involved in cell wall biosynthesis
MKILLALSYSPCPIKRGTDRLVMNLIEGLSRRHEVVLVTMTLTEEEDEALRALESDSIAVRSMRAPNARSLIHRGYYKMRNTILSGTERIPRQTLYAAPPEYLRLVRKTAADRRVDIVFAFYWHLYELPRMVRHARVAIATQDIDFLVHPKRLSHIGGRLGRLRVSLDAGMKERIERAAYREADIILTVTDRDRDVLEDMYGGDKCIRTLPLAMDLNSFRPNAFERHGDRILFLGAFDADFNRDALVYFLTAIFPRCLEKHPDITLHVVGQGIDDSIRTLAGPGVVFHGRVPDIRAHLGRSRLMVLPLRFGGGVRIRMMEAAAMGVPVVSTPVGVGGMGLLAGRDYLEADDAEAMVEAVLRLIDDSALAADIGGNARIWAEKNISMKDYPARLDFFLEDISSNSRKSRV